MQRVVPVLDPQPTAVPGGDEGRAVPGRVHPGSRRPQPPINGGPVLQLHRRADQPVHLRPDPDRDDREVGLQPASAWQHEPVGLQRTPPAGPAAGPPRPRRTTAPSPTPPRPRAPRASGQAAASTTVTRQPRARAVVASSAPIHPAPTTASWVPGQQRVPDRPGIVERAQGTAARRFRAGRPGRTRWPAPGRRRRAPRGRSAALPIQAGGCLTQPEVQPERRRVRRQRGVVELAGHELLGQRRAIVRRPGLGPHHGDRARVAPAAESSAVRSPARPAPSDHHPFDPHEHLR